MIAKTKSVTTLDQNSNALEFSRKQLRTLTPENLAERANHFHDKALKAGRSMVLFAKQSGDALRQAKNKLKHGNFQLWLKDNFNGSYPTAANYMQLAKPENWKLVKAKLEEDLELTLSGALAYIRRSRPKMGKEITIDDLGIWSRRKILVEVRSILEDWTDDELLSCDLLCCGRNHNGLHSVLSLLREEIKPLARTIGDAECKRQTDFYAAIEAKQFTPNTRIAVDEVFRNTVSGEFADRDDLTEFQRGMIAGLANGLASDDAELYSQYVSDARAKGLKYAEETWV